MLGKLWSLFPWCLVPVAELDLGCGDGMLGGEWALKKSQARPRRRDCEVIANRAEPGQIQKL